MCDDHACVYAHDDVRWVDVLHSTAQIHRVYCSMCV